MYLGLWNRVKSAYYAAVSGWKGTLFDFSSWAGRTFWGVDNSTLATNETIFSVITRLSNTVASLPLKMYRDYDIQNNDASDVLLNEPNQYMTSFEFIRLLETIRNEHGNTYAVIERGIRNEVVRITPVDPTYVEPFFNTDDGQLWYKINGANGQYFIHYLDMLHLKHIVKAGCVTGINPIKVLANANDFDKAVREFSLSEMKGARNSFILKYGSNIDKDKRAAVIADFKRFYQENGGILFQEPGVEIDSIERKYVPADTLTSEKITRARVANVFNVPVTFLNDDGQTYSSNEQLMQTFVQMTLVPILRQYEHEFNRKLLTPAERKAGFYFKFNVNALLRGDTAARGAYYQQAIRGGWMSQDEIRMREEMPPIGGNAAKLWVSGDLYPIDMDPSLRKGGEKSGETKENPAENQ